ncbi:hypothetical protein ACOMHN_025077 [Nucella lapillus]
MPRLHYELVLLLTLTTSPLLQAFNHENELRAVVCATACHEAMHWEICAQENECYNLEGGSRVLCMDNCLYNGVNCEFHCWDSFDSVMSTCNGQCSAGDEDNGDDENATECRKSCFLREYESQQN